MKRVFYVAIFHEEDNRYWVSFPDFPECFSEGDTLEECFLHAQEALELCIEDRIINNQILPNPSLKYDKNSNENAILLSCQYDSSKIVA